MELMEDISNKAIMESIKDAKKILRLLMIDVNIGGLQEECIRLLEDCPGNYDNVNLT